MSNSNRNLGDLDKSAFKVNPDDPTDVSRKVCNCLLYTSPSPRDRTRSRMPSSA